MFKLYGTTTSPFVRRVRIVADGLEVPFQLINDDAELKKIAPLWKIPTAVFGDRVIWDSRNIVDFLFEKHDHGPFRGLDDEPWEELGFTNAVDGMLDAAIQRLYLQRENAVAPIYFSKVDSRIHSVFTFLEEKMPLDRPISMVEIGLKTAIDWLAFRNVATMATYPRIQEFSQRLGLEARFASTFPVV